MLPKAKQCAVAATHTRRLTSQPIDDTRSSGMPPGGKRLVDVSITIYNTEHSNKRVPVHGDHSVDHSTKKNNNEIPVKNRITFKDDLVMVKELPSDCEETLPQTVTEASGSAGHDIDTHTSVAPELNSSRFDEYPHQLLVCDICDKSFDHKPTLMQHIQNHPNMHYCPYCDYRTHSRLHLKKHLNSVHTESIFFKTPRCSFKANQKKNRLKHVDAQHAGRGVWYCPHCSCETESNRSLARHIKLEHTKPICSSVRSCQKLNPVRPIDTKCFNCPYCNYKAYEKHIFIKHLDAKHTNRDIFRCDLCRFKSYFKASLIKHLSRHSRKCHL